MVISFYTPFVDSMLTSMNTTAAKTLARLHAHGNVNDPFVISQMEDIKAEIEKSREIGAARCVNPFYPDLNQRIGYLLLTRGILTAGASFLVFRVTSVVFRLGRNSQKKKIGLG